MHKQIQIPDTLWIDIMKFFALLDGEQIDEPYKSLAREIQRQIDAKNERIERRKNFTAYKTAADDTEREKAREKYLDSAGIRQSFRS